MDIINGKFVENGWLVVKRQFVTHGQFVMKWKLITKEQLFSKWKLAAKRAAFAKTKRTKCRYYMLEYYPYEYPYEMKRKNKYLQKNSKYLPEEMIDYPPPWVLLQNGLNDNCMVKSPYNYIYM